MDFISESAPVCVAEDETTWTQKQHAYIRHSRPCWVSTCLSLSDFQSLPADKRHLPSALSAIAQAQQYGGYYSPANGGSGSGSDFGRGGPDGFRGALGFDIDEASRVRAIHGTLAAVAMVALFPVGSVLVRLMPGRLALWTHAVTQLVATAVYVAAAGLGLHLVRMVQGTFGDMVSGFPSRRAPGGTRVRPETAPC